MLDEKLMKVDRNEVFDETEYHNELIYNFKLYYSNFYIRAVDYYIKSATELIVLLDDGRYISYYDPTKSFRDITPPSDMDEKEYGREFGIRLRKKMEEECITQRELSELTGITQPKISNYIKGKIMPSLYVVEKIAKALGCSIDDLRFTFGGKE